MITAEQKQAAIDLMLYQVDLMRADISVVVEPDPKPDPVPDPEPTPDPVEPPVVVPEPEPEPKISAVLTVQQVGDRLHMKTVLSENKPCQTLYRLKGSDEWIERPPENSYNSGTGNGHNQYMPIPADGLYEFKALDHLENSYVTNVVEFEVGKTEKGPIIDVSGRMNNDLAYTDNAADIAKAFEYENAFYAMFGSFKSNANGLSRNYTDLQMFGDGKSVKDGMYSGIYGHRFYHLYDDMFSLGKVIRLTKTQNKTHNADYVSFAVEMVREHYDALVTYKGLENCPDYGIYAGSIYQPAKDRFHFLDFTRFAAWMGFLMESVIYADSDYKTEFTQKAAFILNKLAVEKQDRNVTYMETVVNAPVPHMAAHGAVAAVLLGRISGLSDAVKSMAVKAFTDRVIAFVNPWRLTDVSHAAQTEEALFYLYELSVKGEGVAGLESVNKSMLTGLITAAVPQFNNKSYSATVAPYTESYGDLIKFGGALSPHILAASKYSNNNNSWMTLAHLAYGYAISA